MNDALVECPNCKVEMERGFVVDHAYYSSYPSSWVAGLVEWSRWSGLKIKGREKLPVTTFRCPRCGRLESFAMPGKWPA